MAQLEKHATVRLTGLLEHLPSMESTIASAIKVASSAVASARTSLEGVDVERDLQVRSGATCHLLCVLFVNFLVWFVECLLTAYCGLETFD